MNKLIIADKIRLAVLGTKDMVLRHKMDDWWQFILYKGDEAVGGVELVSSSKAEGWWEIQSLWSTNNSATFILLFGVLQTAQNIVASSNISPAARALVAGVYNRYKGTDVVVEGVLSENLGSSFPPGTHYSPALPAYLTAGYRWSSALRKVPIRIESGELPETEYAKGFGKVYNDSGKTKRNDLNFLLKTNNWRDLSFGLQGNLSNSITRYKVLPWLKKNEGTLRQLGLLEKTIEFIQEFSRDNRINLQKLEIDSFDPTHEYYGGKVQYET